MRASEALIFAETLAASAGRCGERNREGGAQRGADDAAFDHVRILLVLRGGRAFLS